MKKPKSLGDSLPFHAVNLAEHRFARLFHPQIVDSEERNPILQCVMHPDDFKSLKPVPQTHIWTLMEVNGTDILLSGYHYAKRAGYHRIGYVITEVAVSQNTFVLLSKSLH